MFRLLVVEDEEMIRNKIIYNTNWKEHGFVEVFQASNGKEALDIVRKNNIDIVITDIQMPEMNGIELIREIKGLNRGIKCIIITAYAEFEYAKESVRLHVNDYILKPFKSKDLLDIVKKTLGGNYKGEE
ncbi:response regulator [Ruminiclostridium josui]|uniref:response regulator n=1 Tax=Ruminiclostridium josui TaxID=1499 RepID=UPI000A76B2B5|nr:response regulator [Ruminiclostridium josui]